MGKLKKDSANSTSSKDLQKGPIVDETATTQPKRLRVTYKHTLITVLKEKKAVHFSENASHAINSGVTFKQKQYITHSKLDHEESAVYTFVRKQKIGILVLVLALMYLFFTNAVTALGLIVAGLSIIYFVDSVFTLYLVRKNLNVPAELSFNENDLKSITNEELPIYTVLAPLYKEFEVLPDFVENIQKLNYPHDKLDVMLLLEENDTETIALAQKLKMPDYIRTIIVPPSYPKTKPKACNYGLWHAKGDIVVIYDAEDRMDPDQLKKAYLAFKQSPENVACVQAKLNYFNSNQNLLTRFFTAEYSLWFDVILPGFQSINTIIPLGGTSNHFRVNVLKKLHGWDAFNVTEDADLGARLFRKGYKTTIIDSVTWEEANSNVKNWIRQRSRWIKGYLQTYLVHMRRPLQFLRHKGIHWFIFQLIIGMRISFIVINPMLWALTISYFVFNKQVGNIIEALYPAPVFYMAVFSLIFGNFVYLYNYMIGLAKREKWNLIKFVYFVPLYWLLMAVAAWMAIYQLFVKPHHWEKTNHGLVKSKKKESRILNKMRKLDWAVVCIYVGTILLILQVGLTFIAVDAALIAVEVIFYTELILAVIVAGLLLIRFIYLVHSKVIGKFAGSNDAIATIIYIGAGALANFINYVYNAYLTRQLHIEDFGLISLAGSILFITTIPLAALTRAITKQVAFHLGKDKIILAGFWSKVRFKSFLISFVITIGWLVTLPISKDYFNITSNLPFLLLTPIFILNTLNAIDIGFLSGLVKFYILSVLLIAEALVKLLVTVVLIQLGYSEYIYSALPIALAVSFLIGYYFAYKYANHSKEGINTDYNGFPIKNFISFTASRFAVISYLTFDVILAKHFLEPTAAGQYALIALVGKMIFFIGSIIGQPLIPIISKLLGEGKRTLRTLGAMLTLYVLGTFGVYTIVGLLGFITAPILLGDKANSIVQYLPMYGLGMLSFSLASFLITYKQVKEKHFYATLSFLLTILQITLIYSSHSNLDDFVNAMTISGFVNLALVIGAVPVERHINTVVRNLADLANIFSDKVGLDTNNNNLKILIFNWRDTKHVWAGGAEVYLHEIAKRLVGHGHQVTLICGNDQWNSSHEIIDGVNIIRKGGFYTVYLLAPLYYLAKLRNKYDIIIDSENGIPFFTPLFVKKPIICLVHHVHQEIILEQLGLAWYKKPIAYIAKQLEVKGMPYVYKNVQMLTVSDSTLEGMLKIGLGTHKEIKIVNPGVELEKFSVKEKDGYPSVLYLGRIKQYKSIEVVIHAINKLKDKHQNIKFFIAGQGEHLEELEKIVDKHNLHQHVKFLGRVTEEQKTDLMAKSWVFVYPSLWEGWGISVVEANASGTPVVAANVPGLRDSVSNPHSGYLVKHGDVDAFAHRIDLLISDHDLRHRLSAESIEWAKNFSWDKSSEQLLSLIKEVLND